MSVFSGGTPPDIRNTKCYQNPDNFFFQSYFHMKALGYLLVTVNCFLQKYKLLYNVVFISAINQNESAICIHRSPLFWISFAYRSPQSVKYSSLCYTAGSHQLLILYIVSIVQIYQSQSPNTSHFPFPPWCPYVCSLHLSMSLFLPNLDIWDYIDNSVGDIGHTNKIQIMVQKQNKAIVKCCRVSPLHFLITCRFYPTT